MSNLISLNFGFSDKITSCDKWVLCGIDKYGCYSSQAIIFHTGFPKLFFKHEVWLDALQLILPISIEQLLHARHYSKSQGGLINVVSLWIEKNEAQREKIIV